MDIDIESKALMKSIIASRIKYQ